MYGSITLYNLSYNIDYDIKVWFKLISKMLDKSYYIIEIETKKDLHNHISLLNSL